MNKICKACQKELPISAFSERGVKGNPLTNYRTNVGTYTSKCKECKAKAAREWRKNNKGYRGTGKISQYSLEDRKVRSCLSTRLQTAQSNINKWNKRYPKNPRPFDIDLEYLYEVYKKQNGICVYTGLTLSLEKDTDNVLSLDKIDPDKGYTKGNVQLTINAVNRAKGDLREEDYLYICKLVAERCND